MLIQPDRHRLAHLQESEDVVNWRKQCLASSSTSTAGHDGEREPLKKKKSLILKQKTNRDSQTQYPSLSFSGSCSGRGWWCLEEKEALRRRWFLASLRLRDFFRSGRPSKIRLSNIPPRVVLSLSCCCCLRPRVGFVLIELTNILTLVSFDYRDLFYDGSCFSSLGVEAF